MSFRFAIFAIVAVALIGTHLCGCDSDSPRAAVNYNELDLLLSAPLKLQIDECRLGMDAYLWRDFMPISPPDGQPLAASINISTLDSGILAPSIIPLRLWVVKSDSEVWQTDIPTEQIRRYETFLEFPATDGPKWEPGISVEVIVELRKDDQSYYLRASDVLIHRTD
ncbi:MAG: hypothetical protein AB1483_02605 [Candidatus Zixiibacteriota bacterium]